MAIRTGTIGVNGPTWQLDDAVVGPVTITPGIADLNYNSLSTPRVSPFNAYAEVINEVIITGPIQVISANGLFAGLTWLRSFTGLHYLKMTISGVAVPMDDMFLNTQAILYVPATSTKSEIKGYGLLGTCFWTIQMNNEVGYLEIGAGEFEWYGLKEVPVGVQGETEWIATSPWDDQRIFIKSIGIEGPVKINNYARNVFYLLTGVITIKGLENLDTIGVVNMSGLFSYMWSLEGSLVYIMVSGNLEPAVVPLDLSSFNTDDVTDMSLMFSNTWRLKEIKFPDGLDPNASWSTANVVNMSHMFYNAKELETLDVSNWDTSNVTNMDSMFYRTLVLFSGNDNNTLDVSNWDTANVTDMSFMFYQSGVRTSAFHLPVENWIVTRNYEQYTTLMPWMFYRDTDVKNPVVPYDRQNPLTYQKMPDLIIVDISAWETQWAGLPPDVYPCRANMFGIDDLINEEGLWMREPGLVYPDCEDLIKLGCENYNAIYKTTISI